MRAGAALGLEAVGRVVLIVPLGGRAVLIVPLGPAAELRGICRANTEVVGGDQIQPSLRCKFRRAKPPAGEPLLYLWKSGGTLNEFPSC